MQRWTRCSVLFGLLAGIWACSGDPTNNSGKPTLIVADPTILSVAVGASKGVVVSVVDEDGQSLAATFDATQGAGITVTRDETFLPTQTVPPVDIGHQARFVVTGGVVGPTTFTVLAAGLSKDVTVNVTP
jgi:hypothetical protein